MLIGRILATMLVFAWTGAISQTKATPASLSDFPVVMLSDLHFDPMHDPAKVPILTHAPITEWKAILERPVSADQEVRFAALQKACSGKESFDTPYALLRSSFEAAKEHASSAQFVTIGGDLLVHDLDCRYRAAMSLPISDADDQSASADFAEKTTRFVLQQIEVTFPTVPIYFALGNNDSRCNHNRMDTHDRYLAASVRDVLAGLRGVNAKEKAKAARTYTSAGYYSVTMPFPMRNTRLIAIDDVYMMPKYANCSADEQDHQGAQEQMAWLHKQLDDAHARRQRVWMLGHLPPSVNPSGSLEAGAPFCASGKTVRFQTNEDLVHELTLHAGDVKLGIFGHTHMDEFHLLRGEQTSIPIKVVASVTPVSGSLPSFTVAQVNRASAALSDYIVYEASNTTGINTHWSKEYSFDDTYRSTNFSGSSLTRIVVHLREDTNGAGEDSRAYKAHFLKGSSGKKLSRSWQAYVCSLDNATGADFKECVCSNQ